MPKLCQIIAVANGKKSRALAALTEIYHKLQKPALMDGLSRTYRPKDDEGERLPSETKLVQYSVPQALQAIQDTLTDVWDIVATQDAANCIAVADLVVDGATILKNVPVTTLLFLEKQLIELSNVIERLPTLDPGETWLKSDNSAAFTSTPSETVRTKKVPKAFVAHEATKEHPAQVQVFNEDILVGYWTQVKFSGAMPEARKLELQSRVRKLQDAVKSAREEGNGIEVQDQSIAKELFAYLNK